MHITIDRPVVRAIAKIAFSYFAALFGAEAALLPEFDAIRRFARFDEGERITEFIGGFEQSLLDGDPVHVITVHSDSEDKAVVAHVSLFNCFKWRVFLARNEQLRVEPAGHVFDPTTKRIIRLTPVPEGKEIAWVVPHDDSASDDL